MLCSYHETENLRYHTLKGPSQMKVQMVPKATMEQLIKPQVNIKNLLSDFSPVNIAVLDTSKHSIFTELVLLVLIQCFVFKFNKA